MPKLEVEAKFPVDCAVLDEVKRGLSRLGAVHAGDSRERDYYLLHPCRDFIESDEALRIRVTSSGEKVKVTYKGPRMPGRAKSRIEVEAISDNTIIEVFERLGFKTGIVVEKHRSYYKLDGKALILLDDVKGLGCFVEIESINIDDEGILDIASKLGLDTTTMTTDSYAYMLYKRLKREL